MRTDPTIDVVCDNCRVTETLNLTPLARGAYDERDVDAQLETLGWSVHVGDICPDCIKASEEESE